MSSVSSGNQQLASRSALLAASLSSFMAALDVTALNVALPSIKAEFQVGIAQLQWIIGIYTLTFAGFLLTAGALSDRFGARRMLILALTTFALSSVICGLAVDMTWLICARALQGSGAALMLPSSMTLLAAAYPDALQRAKAMATWGGVSAVALVTGPLLGGMLIEWFGWRSVFFVNALPCITAIICILRIPRQVHVRSGYFDWLGQALSLVALACVTFVLIEAPSVGWLTLEILLPLAVASLAGIGFIKAQKIQAHPMMPLQLFESKAFSASLMTGLLQTMAYYGSLFLLPLSLQANGTSPLDVGVAMIPMTIATGMMAAFSGRLIALAGARMVGLLGLLSGTAGAALLGLFGLEMPNLIFGGILIGLGGGTLPIIITACMLSTPAGRIGIGTGMFNVSRQCGGLIGIASIGSVIRLTNDTGLGFLLIGLGFLISATLMVRYLYQNSIEDVMKTNQDHISPG